jgi:hypothetical protein
MRTGLRYAGLVLVTALAGCDTASLHASPPPCSTGEPIIVDPQQAICPGTTCTVTHGEGECDPGYVCTCSKQCIWFEVFYPDGGPACGFPPDAGPDASG